MKPACLIKPDNEEDRLAALRRYNILDTPADGAFDNITNLVAELLDVPIAIVSLVDHDRIWFKSAVGLDVQQIDREPGLCATAILQNTPYLVNEALKDPVTLTNPLVAGEFGLQAYAAAQLRTHDGYNLGTLCCLDFKPREWSQQQASLLRRFADIVMDEIELRLSARRVAQLNGEIMALNRQLHREATTDSLTGLLNRSAVLKKLDDAVDSTDPGKQRTGVLMIDVDHFKEINDTYGHPVGDQVLRGLSQRLTEILRPDDAIGRFGGEEFLIVLPGCDQERASRIAERCRERVADLPLPIMVEGQLQSLQVTISIGVQLNRQSISMPANELIRMADVELYRAKMQGRNQVSVSVSG